MYETIAHPGEAFTGVRPEATAGFEPFVELVEPRDALIQVEQDPSQDAAQIEAARLEYLYSLPSAGFEDDVAAFHETVNQVAAIGYPVENFRNFVRSENGKGKENTLASWGIGASNYGEFTVYELLGRQIPEERLGTIAHESAHANTPLRQENAHLFGGEAERREAAELVAAVAIQSLATGKMLNGYHRRLADQYKAGEIDVGTFVEETSAILSELGITNRAKVEQIQEQQHKAIDDIARANRAQGLAPPPAKVQLISQPDKKGVMVTAGIDKTLVKLLNGVNSYDQLIGHIGNLKARCYSESPRQVAAARHTEQNAESIARNEQFMRMMAEISMRQFIDSLDKDDAAARAKSA